MPERIAPTEICWPAARRMGPPKFGTSAEASCLKTLEADKSVLGPRSFHRIENFLATGGNDTVLRIWKVETGECQREFQGHSREISSVDFSSNGRFVISSSTDGSVMIWELDWEWRFGDKKGTERENLRLDFSLPRTLARTVRHCSPSVNQSASSPSLVQPR